MSKKDTTSIFTNAFKDTLASKLCYAINNNNLINNNNNNNN